MKKRNTRVKNKVVRHSPREIPKGKCIFCGSTDSIEKHHIIQKRFNGSNDESNLVPICSKCHRTLHWITDQLLNYLLAHRKIDNHEVRPVLPIPVGCPETHQDAPKSTEEVKPTPIYISGGEVTIYLK